MPERITGRMTVAQVIHDMRTRGIPIGQKNLVCGIESGAFPFGRVISVGETGRRTLLITASSYYSWADEHFGTYLEEVNRNA